MKPRLLDAFCGAGGVAMGYHRAGFDIVGVDIKPQPNYPFPFVRADALAVLDDLASGRSRLYPTTDAPNLPVAYFTARDFAVVHASPPCQAYSTLNGLTTRDYPALIEPVRELLLAMELPYVIENVVGAPLVNPIRLCGSSFGLRVWRHRLFEMNVRPPPLIPPCSHQQHPEPLDVTGTGGPSSKPRTTPGGGLSRKPANLPDARMAMGIDWMTRSELSEAVPPAFTHFVGSHLMAEINARAAA